ncbi:MAG: class I mannose-6-phosphate isomerase [Bacteroidales bacterium]|nr:class I mannose-6-phosphate isomerase [Bacteroidales bacterium]
MNKLYPLKFTPLYKDKIWGGNKMSTQLGMEYQPLRNCGEAWVLSGVEGNETIVSNGFLAENDLSEIIEIYMDELVGEKVYDKFGLEFPILLKIIDANDFLSIQVHPDDELAMKRHECLGKTEMWYVMDSEKRSEIITGFKKQVDKDSYQEHLKNKTLRDILNIEKPEKGDVYFTPAGRVHAIGPGVMLAEIQQTSDITYRIYDWDRKDDKGNERELHTEKALDAIDFEVHSSYKTEYKDIENQTNTIINDPNFITNIIPLTQGLKKNYEELQSFVIQFCVEGKLSIHWEDEKVNLRAGEAVLIPATMDEITLIPEPTAKVLEVYMDI